MSTEGAPQAQLYSHGGGRRVSVGVLDGHARAEEIARRAHAVAMFAARGAVTELGRLPGMWFFAAEEQVERVIDEVVVALRSAGAEVKFLSEAEVQESMAHQAATGLSILLDDGRLLIRAAQADDEVEQLVRRALAAAAPGRVPVVERLPDGGIEGFVDGATDASLERARRVIGELFSLQVDMRDFPGPRKKPKRRR